MTDAQRELIEMICAMNDEQFARFCELVDKELTEKEREYYKKTGKIGGGG